MSNIRYEYQGAKGLKEISALTGIPTPTLSARIKQLGMTVEQAVNHQKGVFFKAKQHEYQGLVGIAEIARHYGIPLTTLHYRVQTKGMSIEDALSNAACKASPKKEKAKAQAPVKAKKECKKHGTNKPDLLHPLWKLALGIAA
ncbi:helix-turn-helix domain-containing protein [Vibrio cholerae]